MAVHLTFVTCVMIFVACLNRVAGDSTGKIANHPACKDDVSRICKDQVLNNDLAVLDCLQNRRSEDDNDLNVDCHSVLTI